jgi:hypothetical protein
MKKGIIIIMVVLGLASCVKKTDWTLQTQKSNRIVLDGTITSDLKTQTLKLSRTVTELNGIADPVTGATVQISNEDSVFSMIENPAGSGIYKSERPFLAVAGKNYSLLIFYQDQVISAKSAALPGEAFSFLVYSKNDDNGLYSISWVASSFTTAEPAMWEVTLDWSRVPGYQHGDSLSTHARMLFYTLSTLDVSEIFAPAVESVMFPAGTTINETRYSITPEYAEFIREVLLETQWQGGLFNSVPANVPTNMSTGGAGFFAVCGTYTISQSVPLSKFHE